jgi:probable phosphoglycerate mutase
MTELSKEIFIIRHGETDFNQLGIVQGKGVDSSINETGIRQALRFYEAYRQQNFEKIYVSTLRRTWQTVDNFVNDRIPLIQHHGLDEISWGIHEGKSDGDTFRHFYKTLHLWKEGHTHVRIDGGESPEEVQQRQRLFLDELKLSAENKILICSHGRAIRILLCSMLEKDLREMDNYPHQNLSLYKLRLANNTFSLDLFNDVTHLHEG